MWALNYPLLAHFEHYGPIAKDVRLEDWVSGHHRCLDALVDLLARRKGAATPAEPHGRRRPCLAHRLPRPNLTP